MDRGEPAMSDVDTSANIPPWTPMSSEIAPLIESVTGNMSDLSTPMARAVRRGIMELWHPESATIGISTGVGFEEVRGWPSSVWSSGSRTSFTVMIGWGLEGLATHLSSYTWCSTGLACFAVLTTLFTAHNWLYTSALSSSPVFKTSSELFLVLPLGFFGHHVEALSL